MEEGKAYERAGRKYIERRDRTRDGTGDRTANHKKHSKGLSPMSIAEFLEIPIEKVNEVIRKKTLMC